MSDISSIVSSVFDFFTGVSFFGLNMTTWIIIVLVLSGITLFIRGNK